MPRMTMQEQLTFLSEPGILLRIATVRADGSPLVTPIWFIHEDEAIWFTPREKSEWFECLRRDPRVALCIDEQSLPYRKVVIDAAAELVHDLGNDDQWRDRYRRIAERYVPPEGANAYIEDTIDQARGLYKVALSTANVRSWRMPVEGEPGDGIWAQRYYATGSKLRRDY
jgi:PPOX class probable F420-dependent enzyme